MLSRLLYAGENPDLLFDLGMVPTVPPAAQRGFETAHSLNVSLARLCLRLALILPGPESPIRPHSGRPILYTIM
jgi:hypothetical protein